MVCDSYYLKWILDLGDKENLATETVLTDIFNTMQQCNEHLNAVGKWTCEMAPLKT